MTATVQNENQPHTQLTVASRLFGPLNVPESACITFPEGLLGFAGEHRFVLLPAAAEGVYWMQDVDDGSLIFVVVNPFVMFPDYAFDLEDSGCTGLGLTGDSEIGVLAIVTLPRETGAIPTANLQGPLVINYDTRRGCQVILSSGGFGTRHPLDIQTFMNGSSSSFSGGSR